MKKQTYRVIASTSGTASCVVKASSAKEALALASGARWEESETWEFEKTVAIECPDGTTVEGADLEALQ